MRLEEHEAILLARSAVASLAWVVVGVGVLTSGPVAGLHQRASSDARRLALFAPACAGTLIASALSGADLPTGGPLLVPATVGLLAGLLAGLLGVLRPRG